MPATFLRSLLLWGAALAAVFILTASARAQTSNKVSEPGARVGAREGDAGLGRQHTSGVIARVGIEQLPVGCTSTGLPTDPVPWKNKSGSAKCSVSTQQDNIDGLMILVHWSTLQPTAYNEALNSYYIDNAIRSLAHPERQSIHLAILAGTNSPGWLMGASAGSFPDKLGSGLCDPSDRASGGPTPDGRPGKIWNRFTFKGKLKPMPNPFGSNSCLFTALDNLVEKLGQTGEYKRPSTLGYPKRLAPYDDLYYDSAPGKAEFVHTDRPTPTMNKIIGHVSVLGPHSYDAESVLCENQRDCDREGPNYKLWTALEPNDSSMEAAIEDAQKKTIGIYAKYFPNTFWTVDLVQRQMPFFNPEGCSGSNSADKPTPPGPGGRSNDASNCLGKLRADLIDYIRQTYPRHGGVQNNSLSPKPNAIAAHPVWKETALAAQGSPLNTVKLFAGLQVTAPRSFYPTEDKTFQELEKDDQAAVNLAKHMLAGYSPVDFIEFYDVEIAHGASVPTVDGQCSGRSHYIDIPQSAINDDPDGVTKGGFMYVPLMDAHFSLRGETESPPTSLADPPIGPKCPKGTLLAPLPAHHPTKGPTPPPVPKCQPGTRCPPPV